MLTKKQRDLLLYIHKHMTDDDIAPSFEEMKTALGLKSKSGIHRLITALEERGYIERLAHRARALRIIRLPDGIGGARVPHVHGGNVTALTGAGRGAEITSIPLYGKIAAGTPIAAIRDEIETIPIAPHMIGGGEHYALHVDGDSMIKAGINDGDVVIIRRCQSAENGKIVVALVDDEEATLKRLRRAGDKIVLEPENDAYAPQVLEPHRVAIQGQLVSLMRTYH